MSDIAMKPKSKRTGPNTLRRQRIFAKTCMGKKIENTKAIINDQKKIDWLKQPVPKNPAEEKQKQILTEAQKRFYKNHPKGFRDSTIERKLAKEKI